MMGGRRLIGKYKKLNVATVDRSTDNLSFPEELVLSYWVFKSKRSRHSGKLTTSSRDFCES